MTTKHLGPRFREGFTDVGKGDGHANLPNMSDQSEDGPPGETPIQRALRIKQAALAARPKPPRGGRFQREQASRKAAGSTKPWNS